MFALSFSLFDQRLFLLSLSLCLANVCVRLPSLGLGCLLYPGHKDSVPPRQVVSSLPGVKPNDAWLYEWRERFTQESTVPRPNLQLYRFHGSYSMHCRHGNDLPVTVGMVTIL